MSTPRRHHYRSVLHIRHFADESGRVWVKDKTGVTPPFQQRPKNLGFENYLYAPGDGPTPRSPDVENWLAKAIDGPAAAPLAKLGTSGDLDNQERSVLSRFFAVQDMRTPRARDILVALFQAGMGEQWQRWRENPETLADDMERDTGLRQDADDISQFLEAHEPTVNKGTWLDFIQHTMNKGGRRLFASTWWLGYAPPGGQFVTNDLGVAKASRRPINLVPWTLGSSKGRDIWAIPLSSRAVLVITPYGSGAAQQVTAEYMNAVNRQLEDDAIRFVYSRDPIP